MMDRGKRADFRKLVQSKFWSWIVIALVAGGVLLLSLVLSYRGAKAAFIPFQIQAGRHADYSADSMYGMLAGVDLGVVEDLIAEEGATGDAPATLQVQMLTPILTATPRPTSTPARDSDGSTLTPPAASAASPTSTNSSPVSFATYTPANTATAAAAQATQTQAATNGPTPTLTMPAINTATLRPGVIPTSTPVPTSTLAATPTSTPTSTPTGTPGAVPTSTATPTNTPKPGNVPPVHQTRTAVALSATPTYTQVPTRTPTNTRVPTRTPTRTPAPTNTPRPTFTPTQTQPVCLPPDPQMGFVASHTPRDGAQNVPLGTIIEIKFNQIILRNVIEGGIRLTGPGRLDYRIKYDVERGRTVLEISGALRVNSEYTVDIHRTLTNACGVRQGVDVEFTFTTGN